MSPTRHIAKTLALILATGVVGAITFFVALESRSFVRYSLWFNAVAAAIFGLTVIVLGTLSVMLNKAFPGSRLAVALSRVVDQGDDPDD